MRGAIGFDGPAGQQQTEHDTENHLFLFRQEVHWPNITEINRMGNNGIYDSGFMIYDGRKVFGAKIVNQKS
jgi:hypothetical protein